MRLLNSKPSLKIMAVFSIVLLMSSCGVDRSDPEKVVAEYIRNFEHKNFKANYALLSSLAKQYATEDEYVVDCKGEKGDTLDIEWEYACGLPRQLEKDMANPTYLRYQWITTYHTFSNRKGQEEVDKYRSTITLQNENGQWSVCSPDVLISYAEEKFEDQDYEAVKQAAETILTIDPYNLYGLSYLFTHYRFSDFVTREEKRKNMYKWAMQMQTICPWISSPYLSLYYSEIGNKEMQVEFRKKAIEYALDKSDSVSCYSEVGASIINDITWSRSSQEEALEWLYKAHSIDSTDASTNQWIADVLKHQGKTTDAMKHLEVAVNDLDGLSVYNRGWALSDYSAMLYDLGRYQEALDASQKALTYDANDWTAQSILKKAKSKLKGY